MDKNYKSFSALIMSLLANKGAGKKGQGSIIDVVVGIILLVAVAIPVVAQVIANQSFTGTTATIVNLYQLFLAIGGLLLVAKF